MMFSVREGEVSSLVGKKNVSTAVSSELAPGQAMSSRCALRDEVTWLILPASGWRQDLTKPGNTYKETHRRQDRGSPKKSSWRERQVETLFKKKNNAMNDMN